LVYRRQKHTINVFVAAAPDDTSPSAVVRSARGFHVHHWSRGGMSFWAVSDLNDVELTEFVTALQSSYGGNYAAGGRCARRNEWICRTASGIRSFGSFQGNMLTSAFGASIAASIAAAYGCAGMSSGRMRIGVRHVRTKSRVTVNTKSGLVRYILVRNRSTFSMVISGRLA